MAEMSCPNPLFLTKFVIYWQCVKEKVEHVDKLYNDYLELFIQCFFTHMYTNSNVDKTELPNAFKRTNKKNANRNKIEKLI